MEFSYFEEVLETVTKTTSYIWGNTKKKKKKKRWMKMITKNTANGNR
jgi:hypothetical protein